MAEKKAKAKESKPKETKEIKAAPAPAKAVATKTKETPEKARIGVFVCHCGTNIAGVADVKGIVEYAKTL